MKILNETVIIGKSVWSVIFMNRLKWLKWIHFLPFLFQFFNPNLPLKISIEIQSHVRRTSCVVINCSRVKTRIMAINFQLHTFSDLAFSYIGIACCPIVCNASTFLGGCLSRESSVIRADFVSKNLIDCDKKKHLRNVTENGD